MTSAEDGDNWGALLDDPDIRETGGEHNNEGVDFARYLAMSIVVEMERKNTVDYALLFEYLQDLAVLNSSQNPSAATLFQVKKKSRGSWSRAALCKRDSTGSRDDSAGAGNGRGKRLISRSLVGRSPLGKLHVCVEKLSDLAKTEGVFISNAGYDLKSSLGRVMDPYSRVSVPELHAPDLTYITRRLSSELGCQRPRCLDSLYIEQSKLAPPSMREAVRGQIDEMLTTQHPEMPSVSGRLQEWLLNIFSALSSPAGKVSCLRELVAKKGFTRSQFGEVLGKFSHVRGFTSTLETKIDGLKAEGFPARQADKLRNEAGRLWIRLVREPAVRESVHWAAAVSAANAARNLQTYRAELDFVVEAIRGQTQGVVQSGIQINAIALLAIVHVDQEPETTNT